MPQTTCQVYVLVNGMNPMYIATVLAQVVVHATHLHGQILGQMHTLMEFL